MTEEEKEIITAYKHMAGFLQARINIMAMAYPLNKELQELKTHCELAMTNKSYRDDQYFGVATVVSKKNYEKFRAANPNRLDLSKRTPSQLDSDEEAHYWKVL